ncbi:arogenate dehydrogenase 2, chloroplastic-like [Phoenix dactylifera]|uniref:Arogenate dehydrogenase 2, chloroplastic-like n=1 Tax=Phoenix dactylifera TaxID=42345 RepID=A0A8B7C741_PHODC|nr:arogenate dehydrogenase 2, chloroplastic-like [Phoenix dactylifera]
MASSSIHISISNTNLSKITRPDLSAIRMTATSTKVILPSQSISRSSNLRLPSSSSPLRCTSILDHVRMAPEPPNKPREDPLRIAIIGFGNFGQFIARGLARQGHNVLATSRTDYSQYCNRHGIQFFRSLDAMCEEQPDIVLVCTSILSTEGVIRRIPLHKLKPDTIFADVLSVKQYPRNLFVEVLPPEFGIVCTHPMFGPESGRHGWVGLPFVYDQVRVRPHSLQARNCARFLNIFEKEGCRMVHMSCEEHDRYAAGSQFITHTIGRILSHLNLESTPINTKGYETLLNLTENTVSDSTDLYFGLFMYNVNATEQIANLDRAFETVKQKLFGKLHDILREQIVERIPMPGTPTATRVMDPHFLRDANRMEGLTSLIVPRRSEHVK